jgi:MtaA/CmuA family methyltransferase
MMPMYHAAVAETVARIGGEAFVLSMLRGPLNIASQLRGVEQVLMDMMVDPEGLERILDFTTEAAVRCSKASLEAGAHGLAFGEATCSPNFISPDMYRQFVQPRHARLIGELRRMGWRFVGLHVCGAILPILEDLIATGADFIDVDYQVPAGDAVARAGRRIAMRGNLDPVADFLRGAPDALERKVAALRSAAADARWILSSGCDIPPGTPAANLAAFTKNLGDSRKGV